MTIRKLSLLLLLGAAACAHQSRAPQSPKIELRQLCNDASTRSLCTPQPAVDDQLVDTNLAAPPANDALAG